MEKVKMNFFQQIKTAVIKPTEYYRLSKVSSGRLTGFVFLFVFIISLFTIIPFSYGAFGSGGISKVLQENIPDFKMSHGELTVAERYENDDGLTYILIDTSVNEFTLEEVDHSYNQVMLISKTNMISYNNSKTQEFRFSDLGNLSFDKSIVDTFIPLLHVILIIVIIFMYLFMIAGFYLTALLYSIVGLIVSSVSHLTLPYARIFKVAIYSKVTASIVTVLIHLIANLGNISLMSYITTLISIVITCTYVVYGTLSHHSEETPDSTEPASPMNY